MKPSEMKKDKNITVRVNSKVKDYLKTEGISPQKLFDEKIDEIVKILVEVVEDKKIQN